MWVQNPGPVEERPVLLTADLSLQPGGFFVWFCLGALILGLVCLLRRSPGVQAGRKLGVYIYMYTYMYSYTSKDDLKLPVLLPPRS